MTEWIKITTDVCPVNRGLLVDVEYPDKRVTRCLASSVSWKHAHFKGATYRVLRGDAMHDALPKGQLCENCGVIGGHESMCVNALDMRKRLHGSVIKQTATPAPSALNRQEGGTHYKDMPIQPAEYIHANALGFFEGNVVKYVSRWRKKNGIADLQKAKHYIDLLIEMEAKKDQA